MMAILGAITTFIFLESLHIASSYRCDMVPPGVEKMARGVDITRLELIPLEVLGNNGFRGPVLNFTCAKRRTWRTPDQREFDFPDQFWHMTSLPGGWLSADVNLYKSYEEIRKTMANEVGGEGSLWNFAFSASLSFKKMQNTITNSSRYISDVGAFESATRADLLPAWVLAMDEHTQMFLDKVVTGTFETNPEGYNKFIEMFGTHYFNTANFGGYVRVVMETKTDFFYTRSDSEVKAQAKASFLNAISLQGGHASSTDSVDESFLKSTMQTIRYYGGKTNLLANSGITDWQSTVDGDPWLFSGELKPLSDLIVDEEKKKSMEKAVENYVLRSYLGELERLIASAKAKSNDLVLNSLQLRLDEVKKLAVLSFGETSELVKDIQHQISVPAWFTTSTSLCFKWSSTGERDQCGGMVDSTLCAKPNSMTPVYRDNTDNRLGGCLMQWGIMSNGYPPWFAEVKVCFQWYPDGKPEQCGGGAERLLCTGINQFSRAYLDDTDKRGGGCQMSWKLEVPTTAPLWTRTVKMCFSWYPDGDGGQCGSATSKELCAVSNQWTDYYRDDTDNRPGGCRMSWGLKLDF